MLYYIILYYIILYIYHFKVTSKGSTGPRDAKVLPLPLLAMPMRSWPALKMGQHCAWMGVGAANCAARISCSTGTGRPAASQVRLLGIYIHLYTIYYILYRYIYIYRYIYM